MPDNDNKKPSIEKLDLNVIGYSGLQQYGGLIDEEWNTRLRGTYGPKFYREMSDNSSTIGAILFAIESLLRQVEWRVEPADDTSEGEEVASFVEECLIDMDHTFEDFISEVLSELVFGWSYFEVLYKMRRGQTRKYDTHSRFDDGKIGWRGFSLRAQDSLDRWELSERTDILGMHQWDMSTGKRAFIPIEKALHFRTKKTKNNPDGRSLLRNAVTDYSYYKKICKIEAMGIERDMTGLLVMEVPISLLHTTASATDKALLSSLQTMMGQLKRDEREYAIVPAETLADGSPSGFKLKLLSSGGRRQIDTDSIKRSYKIGMLQSVLAQFIELGMAGVGSLALSSSQTDLFAVALGSILNGICSTFNQQAIDTLMNVNGINVDLWPELVHGDLEDRPLGELGTYIQSLASAGQLPDDEAIKRKLLEFAKLPVPSADQRIDEKPQPTPGEETKKSKKGGLKIIRARIN